MRSHKSKFLYKVLLICVNLVLLTSECISGSSCSAPRSPVTTTTSPQTTTRAMPSVRTRGGTTTGTATRITMSREYSLKSFFTNRNSFIIFNNIINMINLYDLMNDDACYVRMRLYIIIFSILINIVIVKLQDKPTLIPLGPQTKQSII